MSRTVKHLNNFRRPTYVSRSIPTTILARMIVSVHSCDCVEIILFGADRTVRVYMEENFRKRGARASEMRNARGNDPKEIYVLIVFSI